MEAPNLDYIKNISGGDSAFEEKIIGLLKIELPKEIEEFKENFKRKDYELAASNVHKLKHKVGILGIPEAHKTTTLFEKQLKQGDTSLYDEFNEITKKITKFVAKLQ